jgi:hypothetical protein
MAGRMGSRSQRSGRVKRGRGRVKVRKAKRVRGSSRTQRTPQVRAGASRGRELRGMDDYEWSGSRWERSTPPHKPGPCTLRRVRVDSGGYVSGQYFGRGAPLYEYDCANEPGAGGYGHVRAGSRAAARAQVLKKFPGSKIRK